MVQAHSNNILANITTNNKNHFVLKRQKNETNNSAVTTTETETAIFGGNRIKPKLLFWF